ncbi:MAG: nitroreductase family protein [Mycetocola sp.]
MTETTITRTAVTSAPIHDVLAERWSPRSFDPTKEVPAEKITAALEAARWSASASNTQPWRFLVARRGTAEHATIVDNLMGFNQVWASSAQVLIVNLASMTSADGTPLRWAQYDLGQAVANLTVQAHHDGLHVHQMGGIEVDGLREAFDIAPELEPISVTALGVLGSPDALTSDVLREREVAPRSRLALDDVVLLNA